MTKKPLLCKLGFHCGHKIGETTKLYGKHGKFGDIYKTYWIDECCKCGDKITYDPDDYPIP